MITQVETVEEIKSGVYEAAQIISNGSPKRSIEAALNQLVFLLLSIDLVHNPRVLGYA